MSSLEKLSYQSANYNRYSHFNHLYRLKPIGKDDKSGKRKFEDSDSDDDEEEELKELKELKTIESKEIKIKIEPGETIYRYPLVNDPILNSFKDYEKNQISSLSSFFGGQKNIFITGRSGTGKTELLIEIGKLLSSNNVKYAMMSPTIDGAIKICGTTVDSWLNIPSIYQPISVILSRIRSSKKDVEKWKNTRAFIIDNIGMLDIDYLYKMDKILREFKEVNKPFGGALLCFAGDLAQFTNKSGNDDEKFFFEIDIWNELDFQTIYLKKNKKHDSSMSQLLDRICLGKTTLEDLELMKKISKRQNAPRLKQLVKINDNYSSEKKIHTPRIHYVKKKCFEENQKLFKKLQPKASNINMATANFKAKEYTIISGSIKDQSEKSSKWLGMMKIGLAKENIHLSIDTQVILLVDLDNLSSSLPFDDQIYSVKAGTIGTIVSWSEEMQSNVDGSNVRYPIIQFSKSEAMLPSSSGASLPLTPPESTAEQKITTTATSTTTTLPSNLSLENKYNPLETKSNPLETKSNPLETKSNPLDSLSLETKCNPLKIGGLGGDEVPPLLIKHYKWENTEISSTYAQLPLAYAWAFTMQDSSELFLESAYLKTGKLIFNSRQFYNCISRVKNLNSLSIESFEPSWLILDPRISTAYKKLESLF
jgi:hypothetical protein